MDCIDLHLILKKIAEQLGAACDSGETDDGIAGGKILSHLDGAQNVVDGKGNLNYRKRGDGSD